MYSPSPESGLDGCRRAKRLQTAASATTLPTSAAASGKAAEPPFKYPAIITSRPADWIAAAIEIGTDEPARRVDKADIDLHTIASNAALKISITATCDRVHSGPSFLK